MGRLIQCCVLLFGLLTLEPQAAEPQLPKKRQEQIEFLRRKIDSQDFELQLWAVQQIEQVAAKELMEDLARIAIDHRNPDLRTAAATVFRKVKCKEKVKIFSQQCLTASGDRLDRALSVLGGYHDPKSAKALAGLLVNRTTPIAMIEDDVLFKQSSSDFKRTLKDLGRQVKEAYKSGLRKKILTQLKTWPEKELMPGLGQALKSTKGQARNEIIHLIGALGVGSGASLLVPFLNKGKEAPYRTASIAACFNIGKHSVPYLANGLDNSNTKSFCSITLILMTRQKIKANKNDWLKWYHSQ